MDKVHYYSTPTEDISLIQAQYQEFAFQRHYHLDFHIGLITQGQQKFVYKGTNHHVGAGQVVIMPPDELHDGHSKLDSGYQVSVFSVSPQWFQDLADPDQNGHASFVQNGRLGFRHLHMNLQLLRCFDFEINIVHVGFILAAIK